MKLLLTLTFYILIASQLFAQADIEHDNNLYYKINFEHLKSKFKLEKNPTIEFKLWTRSSLSSYLNLFILSKKDSVWQASFFEFSNSIWIEKKVKKSNLDSLWKRLVYNKVLTLPDQDSLNEKMRIYEADSTLIYENIEDVYKKISVTDGRIYRFEIKMPEVNRKYYYHNPESYLKHNPNIEELYRAYVIISIVRKYLNLKLYN